MQSMQSESPREPVTRLRRSVSLEHAAELLGVSRRTIYNRIREGRLQTVRTLGGSQRVLVESVDSHRQRHDASDTRDAVTSTPRR